MKTLLFTFSLLFASCFSAFAQPSFLDSTFGNNGVVITPLITSESGVFTSVAVQPDHKIVAAGDAIVRYNENGTLDISFATGGIFIGVSAYSGALAMVLQPDGKIISVEGGG